MHPLDIEIDKIQNAFSQEDRQFRELVDTITNQLKGVDTQSHNQKDVTYITIRHRGGEALIKCNRNLSIDMWYVTNNRSYELYSGVKMCNFMYSLADTLETSRKRK